MKYQITGTTLPAVIITYDNAGETIISQSGGLTWMSSNVGMETSTNGGIGKGLGRLFAGESMFQVNYTAQKAEEEIAFSATVAGQILPVDVAEGSFVIQKGSFLCSEANVKLDTILQKKFSAGLFGGEGFILQKISGSGICFLEVDGDKIVKDLEPGEVIKVSTGNVVAFQDTVAYEIETVKGFKNILLSGEGLFLTKLTGPGKVILQTQNLADFARKISVYIPQTTSSN